MYNMQEIANSALEQFRELEPKDTGNMAYTATVLEKHGESYEIIIQPEKAPYAYYTVCPWRETSPLIWRSEKHPEWNGKKVSFLYKDINTPKKNPNEGWIDRAVLEVATSIAKKTKKNVRITKLTEGVMK